MAGCSEQDMGRLLGFTAAYYDIVMKSGNRASTFLKNKPILHKTFSMLEAMGSFRK
jgi:hypothetical protein